MSAGRGGARHHRAEAFGNDSLRPKTLGPIDAATVQALRSHKLTDQQVHDERVRLKSKAGKP